MSKQNTSPNAQRQIARDSLKPIHSGSASNPRLGILRSNQRSPPVLQSYHRSNRKFRVDSFGDEQLPKVIMNMRPSSGSNRQQQRRRVLSIQEPHMTPLGGLSPIPLSPTPQTPSAFPIDASIEHLQRQISQQIKLNRQISRSLASQLQSRGNSSKCFLIEQLTEKNVYLTKQIEQYKLLLAKLQQELRQVEGHLEVVVAELSSERKIKDQMMQDMALILKRNQMLMVSPVDESGLGDWRIQMSNIGSQIELDQVLRRNKKLQSFAQHVLDMREKVTGRKDLPRDLKACWRWLKETIIFDLESIRKNCHAKHPGKIKQC